MENQEVMQVLQQICTQLSDLNSKVDRHYEENRKEHFEMKNTLIQIRKDIKDLRTDIDTVYDLQKDSINSRKKIKQLL